MSDWVKPDMDDENIIDTAVHRVQSYALEWDYLLREREKLKAAESLCRDNAAADLAVLERYGFALNAGTADCYPSTPERLFAEALVWYRERQKDLEHSD